MTRRNSILSRMTEIGILGDGRTDEAAKLLGIGEGEFRAKLPQLERLGFPQPNPVTGMIDLDAVVAWRRQLHPQVYGLTVAPRARDAASVVRDRLRGEAPCGAAGRARP
jgi:hypothetical protein